MYYFFFCAFLFVLFLFVFFFLMIRRPPRSTLFPTRRSSDLHRRQLALRPFRAHGRDHRRRPADPDRGEDGGQHLTGDPRVEAYAALLVETCVDVQPGWQVLVTGGQLARPLLEE